MPTYHGRKLKMTQVFKSDRAIGVTPIRLTNEADAAAFAEDERVAVRGVSKGKGFQGVVKRHGFAGGPKTHGQKNRWRAPGSIGNTTPQRVIPGRRMAGRMGGVTVTVKNMRIIEVNPTACTVLLEGAVPGVVGSGVRLKKLAA